VNWLRRKKQQREPVTDRRADVTTTEPLASGANANASLLRRAKNLHTAVVKTSYSADLIKQTTQQIMTVMQSINRQMNLQQEAIDKASAIIAELGAFSQEVTASVSAVYAHNIWLSNYAAEDKPKHQQ